MYLAPELGAEVSVSEGACLPPTKDETSVFFRGFILPASFSKSITQIRGRHPILYRVNKSTANLDLRRCCSTKEPSRSTNGIKRSRVTGASDAGGGTLSRCGMVDLPCGK